MTQVNVATAFKGTITSIQIGSAAGPTLHDGRKQVKTALAVAGLVLGACASTVALADDAARARLTNYMCASCHGPDGHSASTGFPKLAGQQAPYIKQQLKAFKERKRDDPPARAYMFGMSSQLTEDMMDELAKHYSSKSPMKSAAVDTSKNELGKAIFEKGLSDIGVPACQMCHGPNAEGRDLYPRLAGQYPEYLLKQMLFFQSGARANAPLMHAVSESMTFDQIQAVVNYAASRN